jgi:oligopeptide transport system substrate-binding protein
MGRRSEPDYEWAWKRVVDPATAADYAAMLYPIRNAAKIHRERMDPSQLGVSAWDDRTLVVNLEQPTAHLPRLLASWPMVPLRRDIVERFGDRWTRAENIVTNGPFVLRQWQHDAQVLLERNDRYWAGPAPLERVEFRIFPENAADQVVAAYEAGELDTLGSATSFEVPPSQVGRIAADPRLGRDLKTLEQAATMFIVVNHRRPYLKDPRVRIALGQALDRSRLLADVMQRVGTPAFSLHPDGVAGRQPDIWPTEDLDRARKNLAAAGFPDGKGFPELTFTYNEDPQWKLLGEYLRQRYGEALGITVKTESMEWGSFLRWRGGEGWARQGDLQRGGWFADFEDPAGWHNVIWDSREDPGLFNTGWRHEEYDRVVREGYGEQDGAKREELYARAEEILAEEYPSIPVFHYAARTLVRPDIDGFRPARVLGLARLDKVRFVDRR